MDGSRLKQFKRIRFWNVFVILWLSYAAFTMTRRSLSVARVIIKNEIDLSDPQFSAVDTAFMLTYSLSQLGYSFMNRRFSHATILLIGMAGTALSCALIAISKRFLFFLVFWGLNGLAQGTGWVSCMSILSVWVFSEERGRVLGIWSTNMSFGGVIGSILPAYVMHFGYSWRTATLIEAMVGPFLFSILITFILRSHPKQCHFPSLEQLDADLSTGGLQRVSQVNSSFGEGDPFAKISAKEVYVNGDVELPIRPSALPPPLPKRGLNRFPFLKAFSLKGVIGYSLSYFLHKLVRYVFILWLPYYLHKEVSMSVEMAAYVASAFDVGGVAGTVLSGIASDRFCGGRRRILMLFGFGLGMVCSTLALCLLSASLAKHTALCTGCVFMSGFFSFAIDALQSGSCLLGYSDAIGAPVGTVSGIVCGIGSLGPIFQFSFTALLSYISWRALYGLLSLATATGCLLMAEALLIEHRAASANCNAF